MNVDAYTYEIVELVPGERTVMRTAQRPFPMETTYTWEAVDGGTLMTLRNTGSPGGFGSLTAPLVGRAIRMAVLAAPRIVPGSQPLCRDPRS